MNFVFNLMIANFYIFVKIKDQIKKKCCLQKATIVLKQAVFNIRKQN